jgi:hypothetical protein
MESKSGSQSKKGQRKTGGGYNNEKNMLAVQTTYEIDVFRF